MRQKRNWNTKPLKLRKNEKPRKASALTGGSHRGHRAPVCSRLPSPDNSTLNSSSLKPHARSRWSHTARFARNLPRSLCAAAPDISSALRVDGRRPFGGRIKRFSFWTAACNSWEVPMPLELPNYHIPFLNSTQGVYFRITIFLVALNSPAPMRRMAQFTCKV